MQTEYGHLTYCTNIHGGEDWPTHFALLQKHVPTIKRQVSPEQPMGLGLRLSDLASKALTDETQLASFQAWMAENDVYVFTMNGFPFGNFHDEVVKEAVHAPDWTTLERRDYTNRLFDILAKILPEGMEGGISTSPLGYRHHYLPSKEAWRAMRQRSTRHILEVVIGLVQVQKEQGKVLHLDIEPEPDGVLENGPEFIDWYVGELLPMGVAMLAEHFGLGEEDAIRALKKHVRLCYDVCHFALGYEDHQAVIAQLKGLGIEIGKFQISAAIKAALAPDSHTRQSVGEAFMAFDEPVYLHQVIARQQNGELVRHKDLPEAQAALLDLDTTEWRAHFHVPIFLENLGVLQSTQSDILATLALHKAGQLTQHLEVETYTWGVLPGELQLPIADSISRELAWVVRQLAK